MMTWEEILRNEQSMVLGAQEKYGDYFRNADGFACLFADFLKSIHPDRYVFAAFLGQIRKHHMLALLSIVRLHHTQAMMDLRQVLEAGASAAYAIANPDPSGFVVIDEAKGTVDVPKRLKDKRHAWLKTNYEDKSNFIENMKKMVNESAAHANLVYAYKGFSFDFDAGQFGTPFFDNEDEYHVKNDLWLTGNIALGLMDLFFGVNKSSEGMIFESDFIPRLKTLEAQNHQLKAELMADPRFKAVS